MKFDFRQCNRLCWAVLFSTFLLSSCISCASATSQKNSPEGLGSAVRIFAYALRWGDYKAAAIFMPANQQQRYWDLADEFNRNVRIVDYEVRQVILEPGSTTGIVILNFRYYQTSDPNMRTRNIQQRWSYAENEKLWRVTENGLDVLLKK